MRKSGFVVKADPAPTLNNVGIPESMTRRRFISSMLLGWSAFIAALTAIAASTARMAFPNVLFEKPSTFKAGFPTEIQDGQVDERFKQSEGVWLVRDGHEIYALLAICTHLGCTPNWLEEEQKFKCPCHGSGYYRSGINFEGPTPRPLERVAISLSEDGRILIDKSRTFRYERGEWGSPGSFVQI